MIYQDAAATPQAGALRVPDFTLLGERGLGDRGAVLLAASGSNDAASRVNPVIEATDALFSADADHGGADDVSACIRGIARALQAHLVRAADHYDTENVLVAKPTGPIKPHHEATDRALQLCLLEPLVRRACLGLVDRVLAEHAVQGSPRVSFITIDALPWLGHTATAAPRLVKRVGRLGATVHVTAVAFNVPDICAAGSNRRVCLLRAGECALLGQDAVRFDHFLRSRCQDIQVQAGARFVAEATQLRAALDGMTSASRSLVSSVTTNVERVPFASVFDALPEEQQARFRVIVAALPSVVPSRAQHAAECSSHLLRAILRRDYDPPRPLPVNLPKVSAAFSVHGWRQAEECSSFICGYKRTIERIAYCALCRLPACVVITGEYSALAESVCAVVTAIYGLDDADDALHSNHEWPPTLGDFEECAVIKWTPPRSVAAALPTNVVRITVHTSGVAVSLAQGWIPADLIVNTSDLVGSGASSAVASPAPVPTHHQGKPCNMPAVLPAPASTPSHAPSTQSATSMRTMGGATSAHLTDEVNPDAIVWELPKNSIIRATLHRANDRAGIRSAMSVMTRYLAARARHAGMFASGDLLKTVCAVDLTPSEVGKGPSLWSPIFLLTQNTGSGAYGIAQGNVCEPAWLINCLRAQSVAMSDDGTGSITIPQPFTHKAGSTLCTREHTES